MRNKTIRTIQVLTMGLPIIVYVWLSATLFNVKTSVNITLNNNNTIQTHYIEDDNKIFFYTMNSGAKFEGGLIEFNNIVNNYGYYAYDGDLIKVNKEYLGVIYNNETKKVEVVDYDVFKLKQKEGKQIPLTIIFSGIAVLIIASVIGAKMDYFKKNKMVAVLVSLSLGTVVLYLIDMIVGDMLRVFLISLSMWIVVMVEENLIKEEKKHLD